MQPNNQGVFVTLLCLAFIMNACSAPSPSSPTPSSTGTAPGETAATASSPEPTPTQLVDKSLHVPEIASTATETIYEQRQRAALGGASTYFWPDGNLGFLPVGDGQFRFFAANSAYSAVTLGTLDDPGAAIENDRLKIEGVDSQFSYAAGGPVYRDPDSGLVLMFYHAERYLGGSAALFHAAIGLAASEDEGQSFQNLGIILENNAAPDVYAPCCADMGGATFTVKDGRFLVYFRDKLEDASTMQLAVATAPVEEVIQAAKNGTVSPWVKYYDGGQEPGLSGRSSHLETGNPTTSWFSVSFNSSIQRYIMAISTPDLTPANGYQLYLTASEDGYRWSPRVLLRETSGELTYPTIISPDGDPFNTSDSFYIYYVTTPRGVGRWQNTNVERMTVTLSGNLLEPVRAWEFEADDAGWKPLNEMGIFEVRDGALFIEATGSDPYMISPILGISGDLFQHVEVRMKVGQGGLGQFFFTTDQVPDTTEDASVVFPVEASDEYVTYTVDMSSSPAWKGAIALLRFDPVTSATDIEIDYIRLAP